MVRSRIQYANGVIDVVVAVTTAGCPIRDRFQTSVREAVSCLP